MGKPWFGRLLLIFLCFASILSANWRPGEMRVRIKKVSPATLRALARMGIDVEQIQLPEAYLYVVPEELTQLRKIGIVAEVIVPDMTEYVKQLRRSSSLAGYYDYRGAQRLADSLGARFPDIFRKVVYGKSVLGQELFAVKISDRVAVDESEPEIGFDGCAHGDEIIGGEILVRLMRDLCLQYGRDPRVTALVNEREIWIFPFANPDGRQSLTRRNFNNVDLNRDWGYMWDGWGNSPAPYSQPETRALLRWILDHQFVINQSFHAGNNLISFPWSYRPHPSPDHAIIAGLAEGYAKASQYRDLSYGNGYRKLYPINGSAKDSYYGVRGSLGWTMEVTHQKYPDGVAADSLYRHNLPALLYLLEAAGAGLHGQVVDAATGRGLAARILVKSTEGEYWPVYSDPQQGDFHKILPPGTYHLQVAANGYRTRETTVEIGASGQANLRVALETGGRIFGWQVLACRVPGNNFADDGLTYRALGMPDRRSYSLGNHGWIVLDMGRVLGDVPGEDLRIYEGDMSAEEYSVQIATTPFGPWTSIGSGSGTRGFDITGTDQSVFRYVRIEDLGGQSNGKANAGFDLDAVEAHPLPDVGPFLLATRLVVLDTLGNFNGIWEAGEQVALAVQIANRGLEPAKGGRIRIQCTSPYISLLCDSASFPDIPGDGQVTVTTIRAAAHPQTPAGETAQFRIEISSNGHRWTHPLAATLRGGARLVMPDSFRFDPHFAAFAVERELPVANGGADTLKLFRCRTYSDAFTLRPQQLIVPPGEQGTLWITFRPGAAVHYRDSLEILSNDPRHPRWILPLTGRGKPAPVLQVPRDRLSISLSPVDSATVFFRLENSGGSELLYRFRLVVDSSSWQGVVKPRNLLDVGGFHWSLGQPATEEMSPAFPSGTARKLPFPDGRITALRLARPIPLAGKEVEKLWVSAGGWVATRETALHLPADSLLFSGIPPGVIAPLWAVFIPHSESEVWYRHTREMVRLWWRNLRAANGDDLCSFSLTLTSSGAIVFDYLAMEKPPRGALLGTADMCFRAEEIGLSTPGRIEIVPRVRFRLVSSAGRVAPGKQSMPGVAITSRGLPAGTYRFVVLLETNDPDASLVRIPLSLKIEDPSPFWDKTSSEKPRTAQLQQNYPNPFNPVTTIAFSLPERTHARLSVYNMLGQLVQILVDEELPPGEYQVNWHSVNANGQILPSGLYFYELRTPEISRIKKMILLQ